MRFFTKQLWRDAQEDDDGENARRWSDASVRYLAQLEALRPRLGEAIYGFFADADVHDGELISFQVIDGSRPAPFNEPTRPWKSALPYPVRAELLVQDAYDRHLWTLQYREVRRVAVDYPSDDPLFEYRGTGFSDWGYHELTDAGEGFLRHEVLFASGSTILLEFKEVAVNRRERNPENER